MKAILTTCLTLSLSACVGYGTGVNPSDVAKAAQAGQAGAFCGTYTGVGGSGTVTVAFAAPGTTMQVAKDCASVSVTGASTTSTAPIPAK
jgi:hypothetical protein